MTDHKLIDRARSGDADAFRKLYEAHVDRVYRLAFRMCGEDDMARDMTQDTFIRVHQRLDQFRGDSAFTTWLHAIAVSVTLNGLRKRKRIQSRESPLDESTPHAAPDAVRAEPDLRDRLRSAIDGLPEIYRSVFVMHDLEGYNHREIASALDVAEGTSKARLSRARSRLRTALDDFAPEYA